MAFEKTNMVLQDQEPEKPWGIGRFYVGDEFLRGGPDEAAKAIFRDCVVISCEWRGDRLAYEYTAYNPAFKLPGRHDSIAYYAAVLEQVPRKDGEPGIGNIHTVFRGWQLSDSPHEKVLKENEELRARVEVLTPSAVPVADFNDWVTQINESIRHGGMAND